MTDEIEMIDIDELRRLAQAASPGPWKAGQYLGSPRQFVIHMDVGDKGRGSDVAFTSASFGNDETIANASLIAAANPATVIELLDRLEAAEKERDALRQELDIERLRLAACGVAALGYFTDCAQEYRSASLEDVLILRAKIEQMEQQEPVGWLLDGDFYEVRQMSLYKDNEPLPGQTALYALPGAKGERNER